LNFKNLKTILALPPGVMNWRIFVYWKDSNARFHRKVLFHKMSHVEVFKHIILFVSRSFTWYLFFGWLYLFRTWKYRRKWVLPDGISESRQLLDLFCLTFSFTTPPHNYYFLRLFLIPRKDWLRFIFDHESPKWQDLLSPNVSSFEKEYLRSKHFFTIENNKRGIPSIPTLSFIEKGLDIDWNLIFQPHSIFLKPDSLSQSKGCFKLETNNGIDFNLISKETTYRTSDDILLRECLKNWISKHDYLLQPILVNQNELGKKLGAKELVTFRIISRYSPVGITIISSLLFVPKTINPKRRVAKIIRVNTKSGIIEDSFIYDRINHVSDNDQTWLIGLGKYRIPHWEEIIKICENAHKVCSELKLIGWDLAITDTGPVLIEANNGFSLLKHQMDHQIDFLSEIWA